MSTRKIALFSITFVFSLAFTSSIFAQKGHNHLSAGIEVGPTINYQRRGFPLQIALPFKAYLGTGKNGQFLLRSGWHHFPNLSRELNPDIKSLTRTSIPLTFGYRYNFRKWYLEGSYGAAYDIIQVRYKNSGLAPERTSTWERNYGVEIGKKYPKYDIGMAFYNQGKSHFNTFFMGFKSTYKLGNT